MEATERTADEMAGEFYTQRLAERHAKLQELLGGMHWSMGDGANATNLNALKAAASDFRSDLEQSFTYADYVDMPFLNGQKGFNSELPLSPTGKMVCLMALTEKLAKIEAYCQTALDAMAQLGWMRI